MRHRWTRLAILAAMGALLALPATASAATPALADADQTADGVTLTVERDCSEFPMEDPDHPLSGVLITITGLPPNTLIGGTAQVGSGDPGTTQLLTDADGTWGPLYIGTGHPDLFSFSFEWNGVTYSESLYVDCSEPASKKDCDHGEWRRYDRFDFKSQGKCIAWVRKNPEPAP